MSDPANPRPTLSPDEALPRVEPPSGAFIVQLFVVPAIIVLVIVAIWVLFNWLANMGSDPQQYLEQIRKQNANSWIAAHNLAEELRTKPALRQNVEVAQQLGLMLKESIDEGRTNSDDVQLRVFLCRALGEFYVSDGLPALIEAANTQRNEADLDVRRTALEAIALLVSHVREKKASSGALDHAQIAQTLLKASREDSPQLREGAAYALGVLGDEAANARLVELLNDGQANVRFNAATGLARQGRVEALEVLIEMLDVENLEGVAEEEGPRAQDFKRALIVINGLRAARQLVIAKPEIDTKELQQALVELLRSDLKKSFAQADYAAEIVAQAKELADLLGARAP
jgi:HEAT repeat protein